MKPLIVIILILVLLALIITIRAFYELNTLQLVKYDLETKKLASDEHKRFVFISDLHSRKYGKDNEKLIRLIKEQYPDYILVGGDMVVASKNKDDAEVIKLLSNLSKITAVYYALGNHEKHLEVCPDKFGDRFLRFKSFLDNNNITLLQNKNVKLSNEIVLSGLDIDFKYYKKLNTPKYCFENIEDDLGVLDKNSFNILLAHNPKHFELYSMINADLVLSGHYHGGAVGFGANYGLISPQFKLFPKYCKGKFSKNNTTMIVTSGCGSHKVNLRLNNKPEVVVIDIYGHFI